MARARQARVHRTESEPEQRRFLEQYELEQSLQFEQPHQLHRDQHDAAPHGDSEDQGHPIRRFQVLKSTALGLIFPQNLQLELREDENRYLGSSIQESIPKFISNDLKWWKLKYILPPTLKLYPSQVGLGMKPSRSSTTSSEVHGLPQNLGTNVYDEDRDKYNKSKPRNQPESDAYPFAIIKYPGWQGVFQFTVDLTVYNMSQSMHYSRSHTSDPTDEMRSRWTIKRVGFAREYNMIPIIGSPSTPRLKWRSSKTILDIPEMQDGYPKVHGNLKLEGPDGELLAVYKQRRDWEVLGSLTVFTERLRNGVTVEVVVASCLAVVMYERIGWQNGFGL